MKLHKVIFVILIFLCQLEIYSQTIAIDLGYPNAFPGLDNHMKIVVENIPCHKIYVESKNGKVIKTNEECHFIYRAKQIGADTLDIYSVNISDTLLIEQRRILVKKWPKQPAEFGRHGSRKMTKSEFMITQEVIARISGFDMSGKHKVKSYQITLIRSDKEIYKLKNIGGKIENRNLKILKDIKNNDIILFSNIHAFMPGEKETTRLNDITIKIKN